MFLPKNESNVDRPTSQVIKKSESAWYKDMYYEKKNDWKIVKNNSLTN